MWNRKELKEKAKVVFKANYWRCVLAAILLLLFAGVGSGLSLCTNGANTVNKSVAPSQATVQVNVPRSNGSAVATQGTTNVNSAQKQAADIVAGMTQQEKKAAAAGILAITGIVFAALFVLMVVHCILRIFVFNPLAVGLYAFFADNVSNKVDLGSVRKGFAPSYMRNVGSMLVRDIFLFLWSLLFIVPGLIKAYSYRMVPYILAENPDMKPVDAITRSREIMDGNKWNSFVLDLSFIGWHLLSGITFGIVGIFYVYPYVYQTDAELYTAIKNK